MAAIPEEDQELIDNLRKTLESLYDQEQDADLRKNETLRKAAHDEIIKIQNFIKSVVDFHINKEY